MADYYYAGRSLERQIEIEPIPDLIVIAFPHRAPALSRNPQLLIQDSMDAAGLGETPKQRRPPSQLEPSGFSVWQIEGLSGSPERSRVFFSELRQRLAQSRDFQSAELAVPLSLDEDSVQLLGNTLVVGFDSPISPQQLQERLKPVRAEVVRRILALKNTYVVAFPEGDFRDHLSAARSLVENGAAEYAEPDFLFAFDPQDRSGPDTSRDAPVEASSGSDDQLLGECTLPPDFSADFSGTEFPNDPFADLEESGYFKIQRIKEAWSLLAENFGPERALGGEINVAVIDASQLAQHSDFGDFAYVEVISGSGPGSGSSRHGTAVCSMLFALANNQCGVAGLVPSANSGYFGVSDTSVTYSSAFAEVLLWVAGFPSANETLGLDSVTAPMAADVINLSLGRPYSPNEELETVFDDTFVEITTKGRNGLGTPLIFSAGNYNVPLDTTTQLWKLHPATIVVGNIDSAGFLANSSGGTKVDYYAVGHNSTVIYRNSNLQFAIDTAFSSTSAAAPIITGIVALMLSARPTLTESAVRTILKNASLEIFPAPQLNPVAADEAVKLALAWSPDFGLSLLYYLRRAMDKLRRRLSRF